MTELPGDLGPRPEVTAASEDLLAAWDGLDPRIRAVQPAGLREAVEGLRAALVGDDAWDPRPYIAAHEWVFARTVPDRPHWYVTPSSTTDASAHERFIRLIQRRGEVERFEGRRYRYLTIDAWRYWVGPPGLINRKHADP